MTLRNHGFLLRRRRFIAPSMPRDESEIDSAMLAALERARVPPRLIYAYRKTGLFVDAGGYGRLCEKDRRAWDEAVAEFDRMQGGVKSDSEDR